jgi:hypothetical protein
MYTVGLQSAADAFLLSSFKAQVVLALCILFALLVFGHGPHTDDIPAQTPVFLPGPHLLAIAPFFQRRFEFLNDGFRKTGQKLFQFNMLRVRPLRFDGHELILTSSIGNCHRRVRRDGTESVFRQQILRPHGRVQSVVWRSRFRYYWLSHRH